MSNEFQREYLVRLPLPLAQLYGRAYNAKDGRGRHDSCFYLGEAIVKLAAAPLIVTYLYEARRDGNRVESIDNLLVQLALPSFGHWTNFLRELARHFGSRADAASHPLGHVWDQLNTKHRDLPGALALYQHIKNGPEGEPAGDKSCSLLQLIDSLVQYRNTVFGHGAGRVDSFYDEVMGPLLFPAVNDFMAEGTFDLLGPRGSKLVYLVEVKTVEENRVELGMRELVGLQGERMAPLVLDAKQADGLLPHRVAVLWPGHKAPLPLDPLLVYRENELSEDVLFLNRDRHGRQVEYLSYSTGRTERDKSMVPAMSRMLSDITGKEVTEERLERIQEKPQSWSMSVEAIADTSQPARHVLGDFEIVSELGRGGMGVVYLARQLSLGRLVALKMLPADMAGNEVALARFRREMRALGRCEHPNIVKVLSSGTLPDGQLYYAMEYVPGADLEQTWCELAGPNRHGSAKTLGGTTWCRAVVNASGKAREKNLQRTNAGRGEQIVAAKSAASQPASAGDVALPPLPELPSHEQDPGGYVRHVAMIIRDAAQALQAVHDQNIVHRDIKPANLMLTPDGSRVVLMDFGLVKADAMSLTATHSAGFMGTLRYSAPEQLAAAQLKVGPLADVHALGVTMWELLTRDRLFGEAEDERQLTSWVLTRDVPRLRTIDPTLDADLEAIVARATERGEENRLQSAREMADYLDLHLQGKPIPIRIPGLVELAKRWVREHAAVAASAAAAVLAVTITIVVAFVLIARSRNDAIVERNNARSAEQKERAAKEEADARLVIAKQAVDEMLSEVGAETLKNVPQMEGVRAVLLDKAVALYKKIGETSGANDAATRFETAMANFQLGQIRRLLGTGKDPETAEAAYNVAISQLAALSKEYPDDAQYQQQLARSHMWLGELLRDLAGKDRADEAEQNYNAAIEIQSELASRTADRNRSQYQIDLGRSHMNRGIVHKNNGRLADAGNDYGGAQDLLSQVLRDRELASAQDKECRLLLAKCNVNRGVLARQRYKDESDQQLLQSAKDAYLKAIEELNALIEDNPEGRLTYSLVLAKSHNNLANVLKVLEEPNEAIHHSGEAVRICAAFNVGIREVRVELANYYNTKGFNLSKTNPDQAIAEWEKAVDVLESVVQENNNDDLAKERLGRTLCNICWLYREQEMHEEAIKSIDRLANLGCKKSRFAKTAELLEAGRDKVQDQNPEFAAKYDEQANRFRNLEQAAE